MSQNATHRAGRFAGIGRWRKPTALISALLVVVALAVGGVQGPAAAVTSLSSTTLISEQTFFVYLKAGELPRYAFTQTAQGPETVDITVTDPTGNVQQHCAVPGGSANGVRCSSAGAVSATSAGIWKIHYDPHTAGPAVRHTWDIAASASGVDIPGRVWVEHYVMSQIGSGVNDFAFWIGTREGYLYRADFGKFFGIVSGIESSGFGLTASPTSCVPLYHSVEGAGAGNNDCGVDYKLFLEKPAADLPASADIAGGTDWIRPAVTPAAVTNLKLQQNTPLTRAGNLTFDLAGVNGGYSIQLDTNNNGSYTDPVDRVIPYGSPPGPVSVPFDGLDGQGKALSVCDPMKAKVVLDKVGEAHLVLRDVEGFSGGLKITGATPGIVGANPKVYWDDRNLTPLAGQAVLPSADGRNGVDTSATDTGTHSWTDWGNNRSIDNWTYYQAQAGAELAIPDQCSPKLTLDKKANLDDKNGNGLADLGETISYTFDVTNSGNASVSGISVTDPKVSGITPATAALEPGDSTTFTSTPYEVTSADLVKGSIDNTAVANGTSPVGPVTSNEDSTKTPASPPPDFGDAPASYGSLLADDGARNELIGFDRAEHTATLMLGDHVDSELDATPNAAASGDDSTGIDDEDGVATPISITSGDTSTVDVSVTNNLSGPATLAGWIDLNGDGKFDQSERSTAAIPASSGSKTYALSFPAGTTTANTYARFRVQRGAVDSPSPVGGETAGEVEDYRVEVLNAALSVAKTSDATASSRPGDKVTYKVTLTNTGTGAFTVTNPARLVDDLSGVLDDADYNDDATATIDGTAVSDPTVGGGRIRWQGTLDAAKSVVVTYSVTLTGGGDGTVRNVAFVPANDDPDPKTPDCAASTPTCATSQDVLPKLVISKSADRVDLPAAGEKLTYTVVVRNAGPGSYTATAPATFSDDLGDVLDDADLVGQPSANVGTATVQDGHLTWTGVLTAGGSATITYTVAYNGDGDQQLQNAACVPADEALDPSVRCAKVQTPGSGLVQSKSVDPASGTAVEAGDELTYTLTFQNGGDAAATVDTHDDLSDVLDDAELVDGPTAGTGLTATAVDDHIDISGTVAPGATRTVTYTVRVRSYDDQDNHVLVNALACEPGAADGCQPATTSNPVRRLTVSKTSDATASSRPGDKVTYTVTLTNTGTGAYTSQDPARLVDDLTDVVDDANYGKDATARIDGDPVDAPTVDGARLLWSGPLGAGKSVVLTYSVTLTGGGDGTVRNVAFAPTTGDPVPTPDCGDTSLPCAQESFKLPKLSIKKEADATAVHEHGDDVTYTVAVKNEGPGDYTNTDPASFTDDLSDVLDDADLDTDSVDASTGDVTVAQSDLSWTGVLAAGDSATISYTVHYTGAGDHDLENTACVPKSEATDQDEACTSASKVVGPALTFSKSADPADGEAVQSGGTVTYTLTFDNSEGKAAADVDSVDDLSGVLDDATLDTDSLEDQSLTPALDDAEHPTELNLKGSVPAGEVVTFTYRVTVKDFDDQGDHVLKNALLCPDGAASDCKDATTSNPVRHVTVTKTASVPRGVDTGDEVTYTVTVTNDGATPYTKDDPAQVTDDLTDVLDDTTFDPSSVTKTSGSTSFTTPKLTWTGALTTSGDGATASFSYTVKVTNQGDHELENSVRLKGCPTDPVDIACAPDPVITHLPHVVLTKTSDPKSGSDLAAGDEVTYTLTFENDGTADGKVDTTDDLSDVLDDADLTDGPDSSDDDVTASVSDDDALRVAGGIEAGQKVTVTYTVTVKADGKRDNNTLTNVATQDTPQVDCDDDGACDPVAPARTTHHVGELEDAKSVDPADGTSVVTGQQLTYTLTFHNKGTGPVEVNREDDYAGVTDDASPVSAPVASDDALSVSIPTDGRFAITGTLAPDQTVTVTYTVAVRGPDDRGDGVLANFLLDPDEDPPSTCDSADCTSNPVSEVAVSKTVDPDDGTKVAPGDRLTYTLTFTNEGSGAGKIDHVDHLADVQDDATLVGDPKVSDDAVTATIDGDALAVAGPIGAGEEVTVTYVVKVKDRDDLGDGKLANFVGVTGDPVPDECDADDPTCTSNGVLDASDGGGNSGGGHDGNGILPDTGGPMGPWTLPLAALLVLAGAGAIRIGRRQPRGSRRL